jgi:hypothetical protein
LVASVARPLATVVAKRTQRLHRNAAAYLVIRKSPNLKASVLSRRAAESSSRTIGDAQRLGRRRPARAAADRFTYKLAGH